jgi:multidrug efflux system outer membrane protein
MTMKTHSGKTILFLLLISFIIYSCKVGPNFVSPSVEAPVNYRTASKPDSSIANMAWWDLFQDSVLQNIILTTLENNRDLRVSVLRMQENELRMGIVRSNLYPRLDYSIGGSASVTTDNNSADLTPNLGLSYEVDLWGKIHRLNEAALQEYLASEQAYRSITIGLISSVASNYLILRDIDNRIIISEQMAETWQANLEIVDSKFRAGLVSGVNLNQAEIQLSEALISIRTNERLRSQTENGLSILMGIPPQSIPRGATLQDQIFPPALPMGLPSELLSRRPDILQAERGLNAQSERIGVAEALRYPSLKLGLDMGADITSSSLGFLSLGAQLLGPIFNAKANKRRVEVEKNRTEQLLNVYEQTFLMALAEVEDAMIAVEKYGQEYEIRVSQMESANSAVKLSWIRYESGLTGYLEILDLQRSQFNSNLQASKALQLQLTSSIQLYKALGGGWNPQQ